MDALFTRISSIIIFMLPFLCLQATTLKADDEKGKANELPKVALILGFNPSPEAAIIQNILGTILEKKGFAQVERFPVRNRKTGCQIAGRKRLPHSSAAKGVHVVRGNLAEFRRFYES